MNSDLLPEIIQAVQETGVMLVVGLSLSILFGGCLGILLFLWNEKLLLKNKTLYLGAGGLVNIVRSFPFVILMVAFSPLAKWMTGTSIGPLAASIPLAIAGIAYFARLVELALAEVSKGVIEAAISMGSPLRRIVFCVLLVEARSALVLGLTALSISYLSFTAAAGMIGGGGIGDFAIRHGYYRFQTETMIVTVAGLVFFVQCVQSLGNWAARVLDKRR